MDRPDGSAGPRVLGARHPRLSELRRHLRRRSSRSADVVVEGARTVGEALDTGLTVRTVVVAERGLSRSEVSALLGRLGPGVEQLVVPDHTFDRLADTVSPQPVLALVDRPATAIPVQAEPDAVVLVLVDVGDPGNVGTLVRTADAVAATLVVTVGGADPWGPKAVRASAGSVLRVPIAAVGTVDEAVDGLRRAGLAIVGTDVRAGESHVAGALTPPVAIVLGSEPRGLDERVRGLVDRWVHIAMPGRSESLNVAMAGTLLAFEARRP